jgi:hypothetical protein
MGAVTGRATPPSGVTVTTLAKATLPGPLTIQVPKVVTVTQKVRVRTVSGKTVIRLVRVKKTVLAPVLACTATSACDIIDVPVFAPGRTEGRHSHPGVVAVAEGDVPVEISGTHVFPAARYSTPAAALAVRRAEGVDSPPPIPSAYGEKVARPEKTSMPRDPFPVQSACAFAFVEATAM